MSKANLQHTQFFLIAIWLVGSFSCSQAPWANSLTGAQIRKVLEQGSSLERGIIQVSGLEASYNTAAAVGGRLNIK